MSPGRGRARAAHHALLGAFRAALALLASWGCAREEAAPALELLSFRQGGRGDVALNESLVLDFSAPLDPSSVTSESVRVSDESGRPVSGAFEVRRSQLQFHPSLPRKPELSDGGFVPSRAYRLGLLGFPAPDGLRSLDGRPLAATLALRFATAGPSEPTTFLELRSDEATRAWIAVEERSVGPLGPVRLQLGEAADPTTLFGEDFELRKLEQGSGEELGTSARMVRIPLRARLIENGRERARIELRPLGAGDGFLRALDPGTLYLWIDPSRLRLSAMGGRPFRPAWGAREVVAITVQGPQPGRFREDFEGAGRRSPELIADVEAMAAWGGGAVTVRLPRAAGSGKLGRVELAGDLDVGDLHASRLVVPAGERCELSGVEGPVILRSQGQLVVSGRIERRLETGEGAIRPEEAHRSWRWRTREHEGWVAPSMLVDFAQALETPGNPAEPPRTALSAWLRSVVERNLPWTILVAGGDLVVHGEVSVDGPLLLVAGGWIRAFGRVEARETWTLREGGGDIQPEPLFAPLRMDEPETNPLVEPLSAAVLSDRIRPPEGIARWRGASFAGSQGRGRFRVRFLGERDVPPAGVEVYGPVDDPALLEDCGGLRLFLELEALPPETPGEPWNPPRIEAVEVTWDEPPRAPAVLSRFPN